MFNIDDSVWDKLQSSIKTAIVEAYKEDRVNNYKEMYLSKIGSYGYIAIDELDQNSNSGRIAQITRDNTVETIQTLLQEEYKKLDSMDNDSSILLTLQEKEYQFRKKIDNIKQGVYR